MIFNDKVQWRGGQRGLSQTVWDAVVVVGWLYKLLLLLLLGGCLAGEVLAFSVATSAIFFACSLVSLAVSTSVLEGDSRCIFVKIHSKPFIVLVTLLLNRARPNSWTSLVTPNKLEKTQASLQILVQPLLVRVHTVHTSFLHHHQPGMVDVPGEGGHGLILWVHIESFRMYTK